MFKNFAATFLCLGMMISQTGTCNQLEDFAKSHVEETLQKNNLQADPVFHSLSPELLKAITKSFYLLKECSPSLLEEGSYLEFGLYRGFSLWFAQQVGMTFAEPGFKYFGFDSFAGLPTTSQDYWISWAPSLFAASLEEVTSHLSRHRADFSTLSLIKGWYGHKLFTQWDQTNPNIKSAIITIDADIYESCLEILNFFSARHIQPGTIILFDDFFANHYAPPETFGPVINTFGERKALIEFMSRNKDFKLTYLFPFGWHGYAFMVTSCKNGTLDKATQEQVLQLIGELKMPEHPFF